MPYRSEPAVDFDAYKTIFTHSLSFVMFVFFIVVFWFFLGFVGVTTSFEIDDDQHVTKTVRHVAAAFKGQIFSELWHVAKHSEVFHINRIQRSSSDDFGTIDLSRSKKKGGRSQTMKYESWLLVKRMHELKFERRTIDITVQNEFSLNIKSEKTFDRVQILPYKRFHQLCFNNRDQILVSPKGPLLELHRGEVSDPVIRFFRVILLKSR